MESSSGGFIPSSPLLCLSRSYDYTASVAGVDVSEGGGSVPLRMETSSQDTALVGLRSQRAARCGPAGLAPTHLCTEPGTYRWLPVRSGGRLRKNEIVPEVI